jgi:hypothetical protein
VGVVAGVVEVVDEATGGVAGEVVGEVLVVPDVRAGDAGLVAEGRAAVVPAVAATRGARSDPASGGADG